MSLVPNPFTGYGTPAPPTPERDHYIEKWSATPTPIFDEFKVDWKKLTADNPAEIKRISGMWQEKLKKLKEKYPGFNFDAKAKWPSGNSMVSPHAFWFPTLLEFQRLERAAASGYESGDAMMSAATREMAKHADFKKARDRADTLRYSKVKTGDLLGLNEKKKEEKDLLTFPSREEELKDLFPPSGPAGAGAGTSGGKRRKTRKQRKSKKSRRSTRKA